MPVSLSTNDLKDAADAAEILAAPLDHATTDEWRSAVNRCLQHLLNADSAGFLLPAGDGPIVYSDEHDPEALARYPDTPPPALRDGRPIFARMVDLKVATLPEAYGSDYGLYLKSEYYNDYAGANGAHDTLAAMVSLGGTTAMTTAGLQFWHERPDGKKFEERETALLRLLYPTFRIGVESEVRWGHHRLDLLSTLDGLGHPTLICEPMGKELHRTPALTAALAADPEGSRVLQMMKRVGTSAAVTSQGVVRGAASADSGLDVETAYASYRISPATYREEASNGRALVLVGLERTSAVLRTADELQARYQLTPTEVKVSAILGRGCSNAEIASELCISPHTARRHTERILFKLKARSRAEVASKLLR